MKKLKSISIIKKLIYSIILVIPLLFCTSAVVISISGLQSVEIGYFETSKSLTTNIKYKTDENGIYKIIVDLNNHKQYSETVAIANKETTTFGFDSITFDKTWLYASNNVLSLNVINTFYNDPIVAQSVTFDCGYSQYFEVSNNETALQSPKCYLAIRKGILNSYSDSFTIHKNDEYVNCLNNNIELSNNYLDLKLAENTIPVKKPKASLIIRDNYNSFTIGKINYDSAKRSYYRTITLHSTLSIENGTFSYLFSMEKNAVSLSNLQMFDQKIYNSQSDLFLSSDFFIPIGFNANNCALTIEILIENVGYFNSAFVLKTTYYPCSENFGSCLVGDYCVIRNK